MKRLTKVRKYFGMVLILTLFFFLEMSPAATALAASDATPAAVEVVEQPYLDWFYINDDSNSSIVIGDTTISYELYDQNDDPYTPKGGFEATIIDPDGNSVRYSAGSTSVSNVYLDKAGEYDLILRDSTGSSSRNFAVLDAEVSTTGKLSLNYKSTVTLKLMDSDGEILPRRSITVDASEVGGQATAYTTLYDGTVTFSLTPTSQGKVKFTRSGHVVGSLEVTPAYKESGRIAENAADNATRSVLVAQEGWSSSKYAILTRDDVVADAMVAVPMAKKYDAPIFMTPSNELNGAVLNELQSLGVETVFVIGGEGAVSSTVDNQLRGYGFYTNRIFGADRYETAAQIAYWVGSPGTVYLAYGYGEPDALAASAIAAEQGIPILLTDTNILPESTQNELATLAPRHVVLLGGTGVISSELEQSLNQSYVVERWGGVDRYGTQQIILQNYFSEQKAVNNFPAYFTSSSVLPSDVGGGTPYGDALFTAALATKNQGFVISLPPNDIPSSIRTFLLYNKVFIPTGTIVGNRSAISYQVEIELNQLLAR